MKIAKIKTYQQAIQELELLEGNGGIRRDDKGRIVPQSANAIHIFNRAKELAPSGQRWKKLSPEGAFKETTFMRESDRSFSQVDIRSRHHRRH